MSDGLPCCDEFERLASENPSALMTWISAGEMTPADLSFALEALGKTKIAALDLLMGSTTDESPVVREGAIYGLANYFLWIKGRLEEMAEKDPSNGVRYTAKELLEQ